MKRYVILGCFALAACGQSAYERRQTALSRMDIVRLCDDGTMVFFDTTRKRYVFQTNVNTFFRNNWNGDVAVGVTPDQFCKGH